MNYTTTLTEQLEEHLDQLSFEDMSGGFNEYEMEWLLGRDDETQRHLLTIDFDQIREYVDSNMVYVLLISTNVLGDLPSPYISLHHSFASVEQEATRLVEELGQGQYSTIAEIEDAVENGPAEFDDGFSLRYFPIAVDGRSVEI